MLADKKELSFTNSSTLDESACDKLISCHSSFNLTQQDIAEQVKQETNVYRKIHLLQRKGLWHPKVMSKVREPTRTQTHWDYLLEEMTSLCTDFTNQQYLKRATTRDIARMIRKHFREKKKQVQQAHKQEEMHPKHVAANISKIVGVFWADIEKVMVFKEQLLSDEEQKKLLDTHLNLVVNQAEKFSLSLSQGLNRNGLETNRSLPASVPAHNIDETHLEDLSPKNDIEVRMTRRASSLVCPKVPFLLKHQLRAYQHTGLGWLAAMYEKQLNGILADEMGLGKTIQTIALLAHLACEKGIWGPHLIIVPTSVMLNWEMEFKKWCPSFKILTYYGSLKERQEKRMGWTKPNVFHVCITSYRLAVHDHYCFRRKQWVYLILDEAHYIKNFKSQCWQTLLGFQSSHRLLLTGTPLQNNLSELWSLMHFIMPEVFQSQREFQEWFVKPVSGMVEGYENYDKELIRRLHKVLRPFLLRRLKSEVEKQLPKKYEHVLVCKLSKRQRYLYDDFMSRTRTKEVLAAGDFMSVIGILMQLRKVCNHPNLFEPRPIISPFAMESITYKTASIVWGALDYNPFRHVCLSALNLNFTYYDTCLTAYAAHRIRRYKMAPSIIEMADTLPIHKPSPPGGRIKLNITCKRPWRIVPTEAIAPVNASITNSQCLRMPNQHRSPLVFPSTCNGATFSGAIQKSAQRFAEYEPSLLQQSYRVGRYVAEETDSPFYIKQLALCQEACFREKLRSLSRINALRCSACPIFGLDFVESVSLCKGIQYRGNIPHKPYCYFVNRFNSATEQCSGEYWHYTNYLSNIVCSGPERYLKDLNEIIQRFVFVVPLVKAPAIKFHVSHPQPSKLNSVKNYINDLNTKLSPSCAILHPIVSLTSTNFPDPKLIEYDCGKLQTLAHLLHQLKSGHHRALIFTQMSKMLDILEQFLSHHGHTYLRLDGTTKVNMRQALMERFNVDNKIFCFILSTRSGGLGINLTGADTVIFYDSDWNPTMDAQAQDRCHRIGQTRDVHIFRLITERTVEENILRKANQKRLLGDLAIEGGNFTTAFFKKAALHELFEVNESNNGTAAVEDINNDAEKMMNMYNSSQTPGNFSEVQLEQALGKAEEELDFKAATLARNEAAMTFVEFEDSMSFENSEKKSSAEEKFSQIIQQLTPIEKYAVSYLESQQASQALEQTISAEDDEEVKAKKMKLDQPENPIGKEEKEVQFQNSNNHSCLPSSMCNGVSGLPTNFHSFSKLKRCHSDENIEAIEIHTPAMHENEKTKL